MFAPGPGGPEPARLLEPVHLVEVELARALPHLDAGCSADGRAYRRARVLARLHGELVGTAEVALDRGRLSPDALAARLQEALAEELTEHLLRDGLGPLPLTRDGLPWPDRPVCAAELAVVRERAPFASVVIATRDRPDTLAACLDTVLALDYPAFEVIVVDNAPSDGTTATLVAERFPTVVYVEEPLPGLASAHNRGLREARGALVAITDDDVTVDRRWLLELARGFEAADDVGCVTGLIFPGELETPAQVWLEDCVGLNKGHRRRLFDTGPNRPRDPLFPFTAGAFGSGANMAFRVEALAAIGGFDPALGAGTRARGGDDLAAFFDVVASGRTLVYEPRALVRHAHRREADGLRRQMGHYGVGLGAYLAHVVAERPSRALSVARRLPRGIAHARAATAGPRLEGPLAGLHRARRRGLLVGPVAYLGERVRRRHLYGGRGATGRSGHG